MRKIFALATFAVLLVGGCSSTSETAEVVTTPVMSNDPEAVAAREKANADAERRVSAIDEYRAENPGPSVFKKVTDQVEAKFLHEGDAGYTPCTIGRCSVVMVLATYGCESLFLEGNAVDDAGTVVDSVIDSARNLGPGDTAVLHLTSTKESAKRFKITAASCY